MDLSEKDKFMSKNSLLLWINIQKEAGIKSQMEDIIIVGAGMAGLGCARGLHEHGKKFKIIAEEIGGRVQTSPDGEVNYGAYYVTDDCYHVLPYLRKVNKVNFSNSHLHKGKEHYHVFSLRLAKHIPAGIRLLKDLYVFRFHVLNLRKNSQNHSRQELIEQDPLLQKYYHQKAGDYIKENGLESFVAEYLEQFLFASFFCDPRKVSTAVFLGSLLPLIVQSYSFKMFFYKIMKGFQNDIIKDSVIQVTRYNNHFELKTKSHKKYKCRKLVLATPMNITNKFITPQKIKKGINVSFYHLNGEIRKPYDVKGYNFFSVKEGSAISREADGTYLYFYSGKGNIKKYFKRWEVITQKTWKPALFFLGDQYINPNPELRLFLANDHDVPSTEDAFINGMYTAKLVMESK